jgi:MFS family permease
MAGQRRMSLRHNPRFARFWLASTVSDFGTYLTTVALSVMILVTLDGSAFDQGLVNAARWAPYLLFGLVAGIWVDRFERSTVLIAGDVVRAALLVILSLAAWLDVLAVPALMAIIFAFGTAALLSDAAFQSILPLLVPRAQLTRANARLEQSQTVAQTSGAALAGSLVAIASAPVALLVDACSYLFSGAVLYSIRQEPRLPVKHVEAASVTLRGRIAEGLRWIYGHVHLGPLAISTHTWFIGFSMAGAVVPALVILELDLGAFGLGLVLGGAGIGGVAGTVASTLLGDRFGTGRTIVAARLAEPFGVALMALAPAVLIAFDGDIPSGMDRGVLADWPLGAWAALVVAFLGQLIIGVAMGAEGPLQMGFEQAVTPDRLLARMSATRRSVNRGMIVLGAPLGGFLATNVGVPTALWASAAVMVLAGLILAMSPFRSARIELHQLSDEDAQTR